MACALGEAAPGRGSVTADRSRGIGVPGRGAFLPKKDTTMKAYIPSQSAEPMGIVISRGDRAEPTPRFVAWIHAPSPVDIDDLLKEPKAA